MFGERLERRRRRRRGKPGSVCVCSYSRLLQRSGYTLEPLERSPLQSSGSHSRQRSFDPVQRDVSLCYREEERGHSTLLSVRDSPETSVSPPCFVVVVLGREACRRNRVLCRLNAQTDHRTTRTDDC